MPEVISQYLRFGLLKKSLQLDDDDTEQDDKVRELVSEANQVLDTDLRPFIDQIPMEEGSVPYSQAQAVALHYARGMHFKQIYQHKQAEWELGQYERRLKALTQSFLGDRNTRTRSVLVTGDPRDNRVILPMFKDSLVIGEF